MAGFLLRASLASQLNSIRRTATSDACRRTCTRICMLRVKPLCRRPHRLASRRHMCAPNSMLQALVHDVHDVHISDCQLPTNSPLDSNQRASHTSPSNTSTSISSAAMLVYSSPLQRTDAHAQRVRIRPAEPEVGSPKARAFGDMQIVVRGHHDRR